MINLFTSLSYHQTLGFLDQEQVQELNVGGMMGAWNCSSQKIHAWKCIGTILMNEHLFL